MDPLLAKAFKGVISIEQNRKWIFKQAAGEADRSNNRQNRLETRFRIAEGSKIFTAVGILLLVEKKRLGLGDTLGRLLPYDLGRVDKTITVRQLLNHTSGVGEYSEEKDAHKRVSHPISNPWLRAPSDYLPLFIHKPMRFSPGKRFSYSHSGYILLSLIIERVMEMPFERFLEQLVFKPAGMENTGYFALDRLPASCATGYCFDPRLKEFYANIFSIEAKGAYTTSGDMEAFWQALMEGRLLSKKMLKEMLSPQVAEGFYGYGIWLKDKKDEEFLYFIQGEGPGASFISSYDPQLGRSITLMSNYGDDALKMHGQIYEKLMRTL